jgi:hypothetical protein
MGEHLDWGLRACFEADLRCTSIPEVEIVDRTHRGNNGYWAQRRRAVDYRNRNLHRWARRLGFRRLEHRLHPPSSYIIPDDVLQSS